MTDGMDPLVQDATISSPTIHIPTGDPSLPAIIQIFSGLLVLLLQLGLQLVEAGSIRSKNTSAVFMRGLACLTISLVISWVCGYSFSFSSGHYLLGYSSGWFGLHSVPDYVHAHWVIHAAVASLPSAIIAASMSERSHLTGHLVLAMVLAGLVYPLPAHWVWHEEGWLYNKGCRDMGGVIMVHVVGGVAALVGSLLVGPRVERLGNNFRDTSVPGHSLPLAAVGGMLVVVGMVAKVVGLSTRPEEVGQLAVNSIIGGAGGGVVAMYLFKLTFKREVKYSLSQNMPDTTKNTSMANRRWSYLTAYNGFITGMVCVCGAGATLPSWAAFLSGLVGGVAFFMLAVLLRINKLDDPVSGVAVNLSGGVVGALVTGLVNLVETSNGMALAWELVGVVVISAWVVICSLVVMLPLLLCGKLRVRDCQERAGVDSTKILEQAYQGEGEGATAMTRPVFGGVPHQHPGATLGIEKERSPACAFVTPNIREQMATVHLSQWSVMDTKTTAPRIVLEKPSPAVSLQSLAPAPPPYPGSESPQAERETSLTVPEITLSASTASQDDSQTPLLSTTGPSTKALAVDVKELRAALKQQKERLKATNSLLRTPSTNRGPSVGEDLNTSMHSVRSDNSVKSEVVRQVANTASNKENFNYLAGSRKLDMDDDGLVDNVDKEDGAVECKADNAEPKKKPLELSLEGRLSGTVNEANNTTKDEAHFDYSKRDIDDGLAQVTYVEDPKVVNTKNQVKDACETDISIDFESEDDEEDEVAVKKVKESGPI